MIQLLVQVAQHKSNMDAQQMAVATAALSVERDLIKLDFASAAAAAQARAPADCGTMTDVSCAACMLTQRYQKRCGAGSVCCIICGYRNDCIQPLC